MSVYTRNARRILDDLVSGNDPFNINRAAAMRWPVYIISEAWSPERKKEIEQKAMEMGYTLVDHLVIGDYDLALWHTTRFDGLPSAYVVSINNADHNPLSTEAQKTKQTDTAGLPPLKAIKDKVTSWVDERGMVIVGSVLTDRNQLYLRLFKRMFSGGYKFEPFFGDYAYGFKLSKPKS